MRSLLSCVVLCLLTQLTVAEAGAPRATADAEATAARAVLRGRVVDSSGGAVSGAQVTVISLRAGTPAAVATDKQGDFEIATAPGSYVVRVSAGGFVDTSRRVTLTDGTTETMNFTLEIAGVHETVAVEAAGLGYKVPAVTSATKTTTPLRDVPQAVSVVSSALIADQRMTSMADVTRYMPGVGFAQGEGNRDTPILRGNSTTADFFVDGVRDDVQYFRDVYNVERVEALKGPNAMVFGRGGVGGVLNRVTRQADWGQSREASLQLGSWDNKRVTVDAGRGVNQTVAVRGTGLYEKSDSYRQGVGVERYGFNPTVAVRLGSATTLRGSYEFFHDDRVADRGISSFGGRPVDTDPGTFFGDPDQSTSDATVHLLSAGLEHRFGPRVTLRNRLTYGNYDKFYQNVFPGAVERGGNHRRDLGLQQRDRAAERVQPDRPHRRGADRPVRPHAPRRDRVRTAGHRQFPRDGFFTSIGPNVTTVNARSSAPTISCRSIPPERHRRRQPERGNGGRGLPAGPDRADLAARGGRRPAVRQLRRRRHQQPHSDGLRSHDGLLSPRGGPSTSRPRRCRSTAATSSPTCRVPASSCRHCH